ncbi:MAG TPA: NAD(P)/FAD-dependent oxidoreductase [Candidatus Dormibacteraeota bacterium]
MPECADVVVVGAGPSGAATALFLARAGHRVTVLERARFPRDKPCGEGLMPPGVAVLRRLGLLDAVLATGARRLEGITYTHPGEGPTVFAAFPAPPGGGAAWGLGVRRLHFDATLAGALGREPAITLMEGTVVQGLRRRGARIVGVDSSAGPVEAPVVVAADGLHSRVRRLAGWGGRTRGPVRYGLAGHWRLDTSDRCGVTVSLAGHHEWYEAPVGGDELLVSTLGGRAHARTTARDYERMARAAFPALRDAELTGAPMAAGDFHQRPARIAGDGLFLVGDAAGYDDPTTGEGLGVGLQLAEALARRLDAMLTGRSSCAEAVARYARDHRELWRNRRRLTALALFMAGHPAVSRRAVRRAQQRPQTLSRLLAINCGYCSFLRLTPVDWLTLAGL